MQSKIRAVWSPSLRPRPVSASEGDKGDYKKMACSVQPPFCACRDARTGTRGPMLFGAYLGVVVAHFPSSQPVAAARCCCLWVRYAELLQSCSWRLPTEHSETAARRAGKFALSLLIGAGICYVCLQHSPE